MNVAQPLTNAEIIQTKHKIPVSPNGVVDRTSEFENPAQSSGIDRESPRSATGGSFNGSSDEQDSEELADRDSDLTVLAYHSSQDDSSHDDSLHVEPDNTDLIKLSSNNLKYKAKFICIITTLFEPNGAHNLSHAIDDLVKKTFKTEGQKLRDNYDNEATRYKSIVYESCSNELSRLASKIGKILQASVLAYDNPEDINVVITQWLNVLESLINRGNFHAATIIYNELNDKSDLGYYLFNVTQKTFFSEENEKRLERYAEQLEQANVVSFLAMDVAVTEGETALREKIFVPNFLGKTSVFNKMIKLCTVTKDSENLAVRKNKEQFDYYIKQFQVYHDAVPEKNSDVELKITHAIKEITFPEYLSQQDSEEDDFKSRRIKTIKLGVSNPVLVELAVQKRLEPNLVRQHAKELNECMNEKGSERKLKNLLDEKFGSDQFSKEEVLKIHHFNKQNYYHSLIKNKVLRALVKDMPLKSTHVHIMSTEKRLQLINEASSQPNMTQEKYKTLLANVGIQLKLNDLKNVLAEEQKLHATQLITPEEEHWLEVFEVIYEVLHDVTPSLSPKTNFIAGLKHLSVSQRYHAIQEHMKEREKTNPKARSVTVAELTTKYILDVSKNYEISLPAQIVTKAVPDLLGTETYHGVVKQASNALSKFELLLNSTTLDKLEGKVDAIKNAYRDIKKREWKPSFAQTDFLDQLECMTLKQQDYAIKQHIQQYPDSRLARAKALVDRQIDDVKKRQLEVFEVIYGVLREVGCFDIEKHFASNFLSDTQGMNQTDRYHAMVLRANKDDSRSKQAFELAKNYIENTISNDQLIDCIAEAITPKTVSDAEVNAESKQKLKKAIENELKKSEHTLMPLTQRVSDVSNGSESPRSSDVGIKDDALSMESHVKLFQAIHRALQCASSSLMPSQKFIKSIEDLTIAQQYDAIVEHSSKPNSRTQDAWNLTEIFLTSDQNEHDLVSAILKISGVQEDKPRFFGHSKIKRVEDVMGHYFKENFEKLLRVKTDKNSSSQRADEDCWDNSNSFCEFS
jgi:hypothetical protein